MSPSDLELRLARLEAKEDVRATVARYCELNDEITSLEALVGLFTEDAVMTNPAGEHRGRDAISRYYHAFFDGSVQFARHHTMNQVIDIPEPDVARHRSYFLAMLGKDGESRIAFGRYDDVLVRTDGRWLFSTKVNDVVGITTVDAGWARGLGSLAKAVR